MSKSNALTDRGLRIATILTSAKHRVRESPACALDCPGAGCAQQAIRELVEALELMLGAMAPEPGGPDNPFWEKVDA